MMILTKRDKREIVDMIHQIDKRLGIMDMKIGWLENVIREIQGKMK